MSATVSAPATPLLPTNMKLPSMLPTPISPAFPSELPRSARSTTGKAYGFELTADDLKTPITPPAAYMDFLRSAIVAQTPTSATFGKEGITSAPASAACTCRPRLFSARTPLRSSRGRSSSNSTISNSSRESSISSQESYTFQAPPTPLRTPLSATKRLRIPPSPAFSPGMKMNYLDSPMSIYATTPRSPIREEDEEDEDTEPALRSAPLTATIHSCKLHRSSRVIIRASAAGNRAMIKTANMNLMPAPKGKKRRVE